jgi:phosphate transport system substrate-binding protein
VLAFNLHDANGKPITELRLSRKAYTGILLGQIRSWRDDEITRHNPGVAFPDLPIQFEYRLDASGTTSALTRHLSEVSQDWKNGPGIGMSVIWPVGAGMPKDRGVARGLRQVPGSIGYLAYAFARNEGLPMAILENKSGAFVAPDLDSIQLGLSGLSWTISESQAFVTDPLGEGAYPIVTYSWILCYRVYEDPQKLAMLKELISYGLNDGQQLSHDLGYVALMAVVADNAVTALDDITLPQNADAATSIPVSKAGSAPDSITKAVIEVVEEVEGVSPVEPATEAEERTDDDSVTETAVKEEDDVSVKDAAAENDGDDASRTEEQKRGES